MAAPRILVTGATGFVGRVAVPLLRERGLEVHTAGRGDLDLLRERADDLVRRVRPTHLLHLAWTTEPGYQHSQDNFRWVGASLDLARAFADGGGRRLVAAGTCAEYGHAADVCDERATPPAPTTPYGICKDALRRMMESFAAERGLSFAWGRLFFLHGPGERPHRLIPSVVRSLLAGERARCTHGGQIRDLLAVDDAARAFCDLLLSDVTGPVNIASGDAVSIRDVVLAAARQLGAEGRVDFGTIEANGDEPPVLVADTRRLRDEVGWRPRRDLQSGLAASIAWWRAQER